MYEFSLNLDDWVTVSSVDGNSDDDHGHWFRCVKYG